MAGTVVSHIINLCTPAQVPGNSVDEVDDKVEDARCPNQADLPPRRASLWEIVSTPKTLSMALRLTLQRSRRPPSKPKKRSVTSRVDAYQTQPYMQKFLLCLSSSCVLTLAPDALGRKLGAKYSNVVGRVISS